MLDFVVVEWLYLPIEKATIITACVKMEKPDASPALYVKYRLDG